MNDKLAINRLEIKHIAGFPNGLIPMTFCDGVNIIFGPNASGKTTTARAIQSLLWPQDSQKAYMSAEITLNGQIGRYLYIGTERQDDPKMPLPFVGDASYRRRYMLAQHELLSVNETGDEFASTILNEARGGLDLERAKRQLGYEDPGRQRRSTDIVEALKKYHSASSAEQDIRDIESELERIKRELVDASQAQDSLDRMKLALDYLAQKQREERLKDRLEHFPPELKDLTGEELNELDELDTQIRDAEDRLKTAECEIKDAQQLIQDTSLTDSKGAEKMIASIDGILYDLGTLENELRTKQQEEQRAQDEAKRAYLNLGGYDASEYANPLDASAVDALEDFVKTVEGLAARQQALNDQLRWLAGIVTPQDNQSRGILYDAVKCLNQWLAMGIRKLEVPQWLLGVGTTISVLAACTGLVSLVLDRSVFGGLAALGGFVASAFFVLIMHRQGRLKLARQDLKDRFSEFCLDGPSSWSIPEVSRFLHELIERISAIDLAEKAAVKRQELSITLSELDDRVLKLETERKRITGLLRVDPKKAYANGNASLFYFVSQLIEWQHKSATVTTRQTEVNQLEEEIRIKTARANEILNVYGYDRANGSSELRRMLQLLERRRQDFVNAETERRGAERRKQEHMELLDKLTQRRAIMLTRLGLDTDPLATRHLLIRLLPDLEEYRKTSRELQDIIAIRVETEKKGQQSANWGSLITIDELELQRQTDDVSQLAGKVSDLSAQKGEYEHRVRAAKEQTACEQARVSFERVAGRLRQRLEDTLHSAVGFYLTTELKKQIIDTNLPDVFQRAMQLFVEFTSGRYELRINQQSNVFRAFDQVDREERELDQLSSATRLQLLMAVRLAFVEKREHGVRLPLLLDEVLACSDDVRENAIIRTSLEICREGRQVFYFTSKFAEIAKWQQEAVQTGIELVTIDLGETPSDQVINVPNIATQPTLPDPAGLSHLEYGVLLRVPRLDFTRRSASSVHIWYVVMDNKHLRTLLEHGVSTCGQLCSSNFTSLVERLIGNESAQEATALGSLLEELEKLWREGRGKSLDFEVLQEVGILSRDTFRREIPALAESLNWDARAIIAATEEGRIKRLRRESIQRLRDYCEEHGYLGDGEPMPSEVIRARLLDFSKDMIAKRVITADEVQQLCDRVLIEPPV